MFPQKLPPQAHRVFKGNFFEVYQWKQQLYDGSMATWEALRRPDSVIILAVAEGKLWWSRQEQPLSEPFTSLFGGVVDPGETPLEAAKRELREEAGLVSDDWEHYKSYTYSTRILFQGHLFLARNARFDTTQHLDPGERITILSGTFEEFLEVIRQESFRNKEFALDLLRMTPTERQSFQQHLYNKTFTSRQE